MILVGITGSPGTGKSTFADLLVSFGWVCADTDAIAREVSAPGTPGLARIVQEFGSGVLQKDGTLDRATLASIVFAELSLLRKLEAILHPLIRSVWLRKADEWAERGVQRAAVQIPLLFETGSEAKFDHIACVACSSRTFRTRLTQRGWNTPQFEARITAQWTLSKKMEASDLVIWNEGTLEGLHKQAQAVSERAGRV